MKVTDIKKKEIRQIKMRDIPMKSATLCNPITKGNTEVFNKGLISYFDAF